MSDELSTCTACGGEVAKFAAKCPHCGRVYPSKEHQGQNQTIVFGFIGVFILMILGCAGLFVAASNDCESQNKSRCEYRCSQLLGKSLAGDCIKKCMDEACD